MNSRRSKPRSWNECAPHVIAEVHERLLAQALGAKDQAERFRDPDSKHCNEEIARRWDEHARDYGDALEVLKRAARRAR